MPNWTRMFIQDGVFQMSLSPDGTVLAVIHFSGSLSLWDIPSFKLRGSWKQEEQVIKSLCVCVCVCVCVCARFQRLKAEVYAFLDHCFNQCNWKKNDDCFYTGFLNTLLACHWSGNQIALPPNSHHWLSLCCGAGLFGILTQTKQCFESTTV